MLCIGMRRRGRMGEYQIRCGRKEFRTTFPPSWRIRELLPGGHAGQATDTRIIEHALDHPIGRVKLEMLVKPGERIAILVNDITRLYQRPSLFLDSILRRLKGAGSKDRDLFIVIAGGMHGKTAKEQAIQIVGQQIYDRIDVFSHDCHDPAGLISVGTSFTGKPFSLNRSVVESDRVIATGGIVPHGLVGFAGGSKSVLPGIAGYETIQENHRLAFDEGFNLRPEVKQDNVDNNPVVHEMRKAAGLLGVDFMLNLIPGIDGHYAGAVAGDIIEAHRAGCRFARAYFEVPLQSRAPLVIASGGGYPRDVEMYQSIKALSHAAEATEEGGTIIFLSDCEGGIGPEGWLKWFDSGGPKRIATKLTKAFSFPGLIALKTLSLTSRFRVILVSSLSEETVQKLRMETSESLEEAVAMVEKEIPRDCNVLLMPVAGSTLPVIRGGENQGGKAGE